MQIHKNLRNLLSPGGVPNPSLVILVISAISLCVYVYLYIMCVYVCVRACVHMYSVCLCVHTQHTCKVIAKSR